MNKLNVLIVGLGQIGMLYDFENLNENVFLTHSKTIHKMKFFNLVAGVDKDQKLIKMFKKKYNKPGYSSLADALKNFHYDLIVISTPTETHLEVIENIIKQQKPKFIFCEKPLSYKLEEAKKINLICNKNNIKIFVNYPRRSDPMILKVKEKIEQLPMNNKIKGICWYSKGIYNNGSHFINLCEFLLGKVKKSLLINKGRLWDKFDPEPDFQLNFERGNVIFSSLWEEEYSHYSLELFTQFWRFNYEFGGTKFSFNKVVSDKDFPNYKILNSIRSEDNSDFLMLQLHSMELLKKEIEGIKTSLCTGDDAIFTLNSIEEIKSKIN